ncbi:cell division protein FtsQ/DivIB [Aphanothece sacrum]|uniref:Cell division protein n=1 Tax=Aphanothece sacrum FPU1 TaxID=1920663 RepID=A0A401ICC6_APHSA|nr:FtsQ-type POTRA domain-containing protein [Aphanothece sacrum]GBF78899.1 cell division protein [Aphanothece sacrum FPU1]GBF83130.1 cell division protein [Aphanothece sacrum FPU3]
MAISTYVSPDDLKTRRESLQSQRRLKAWQGVWRFVAVCGLTGGLVWTMTLPDWVIREPSQVKILGNKLLSQQQIKQMLSVAYPQPIWELPIHQVKEQLKTQPPIDDVYITRRILPTQITITVRERQPIAEASSRGEVGFLDAQGVWIPQKFYQKGVKPVASDALKVMGFEQQYGQHWNKLYTLIMSSPVKIKLIDWRDPSNLILKTELGMVYCGPYGENFPQQLAVLGRMSKLSSRVPKGRIIYIDLSNPESPSVHLTNPPKTDKDKTKAQEKP